MPFVRKSFACLRPLPVRPDGFICAGILKPNVVTSGLGAGAAVFSVSCFESAAS
jgi:hypothetical protein